MDMQQLSLFAGICSTILFTTSTIPMLLKALRTRDMQSYSVSQIALSNLGNGVHWLYILGLPFGPIWFLHGFHTLTTAVMLVWCVQHHLRTGSHRPPVLRLAWRQKG